MKRKRGQGAPPTGIDCAAVADLLPGIIDGITPATAEVAAHIDVCERCQIELTQYRKLLRALHQLRTEVLEPGLLAEILASLDCDEQHRALSRLLQGRRTKSKNRAGTATAAIGAAGVVAGLGDRAEVLVAFAGGRAQLEYIDTIGQTHIVGPSHEIYEEIYRNLTYSTRLKSAVLELESLLNTPGVQEYELQDFLELFPEMITGFDYVDAIPQVILESDSGKLIPDFVLRPIHHEFCDLLELKLPSAKLLTVRSGRPQFTREVASAISQLKSYAEAISDPRVRERALKRYGLQLYNPRLQLVVGRSHGLSRRALINASQHDVSVSTWDDVLCRARTRFT